MGKVIDNRGYLQGDLNKRVKSRLQGVDPRLYAQDILLSCFVLNRYGQIHTYSGNIIGVNIGVFLHTAFGRSR